MRFVLLFAQTAKKRGCSTVVWGYFSGGSCLCLKHLHEQWLHAGGGHIPRDKAVETLARNHCPSHGSHIIPVAPGGCMCVSELIVLLTFSLNLCPRGHTSHDSLQGIRSGCGADAHQRRRPAVGSMHVRCLATAKVKDVTAPTSPRDADERRRPRVGSMHVSCLFTLKDASPEF